MMSPVQSEKVLPTSLSSTAAEGASNESSRTFIGSSDSKRRSLESDTGLNHLALVSEELGGLSDLVKEIKHEILSYSQIEREYMQQLESALTQETARELVDNTRVKLTVSQIRRIRSYKREALHELTAVNMKIAQLESRVERISNAENEAEINARLYELQMLYGVPAGTDVNTVHSLPRNGRLESEQSSLNEASEKNLSHLKEQGPRAGKKNNRKGSFKQKQARRDRDNSGNGRGHAGTSLNNLTDAARPAEKGLEEMNDEVSKDTQGVHNGIVLSDTDMDASSLSLPIPSSSPGTPEDISDASDELNGNDNGTDKEDDTSINDTITSLMISAQQEHSQPLQMPELDIDESLESGKKKRWGLGFSLGKKKEMKQ